MNDIVAIESTGRQDLYRRLRLRIDAWLETKDGVAFRFADKLLLLPDFVHLIVRLGLDGNVPTELKTQTAAVLAYVAFPLDFVPEVIVGPMGLADDLLLVVLMTRRLLTSVPQEVVLGHWAGSQGLMKSIQGVMDVAEEMVGSKVWNRLRKLADGGAE